MTGETSQPATATAASIGERLARARRRARLALFWERLWPPLAGVLTVGGLFLAVSWAGLWFATPPLGRAAGLVLFAGLAIAAAWPLVRVRFPSRAEALRRLDLNSGIAHRPVTTLTEKPADLRDQASEALWRAHLARTLAAVKNVRAGWPMPRLSLRDPWALRGLVAILMVATFIAAGEERRMRVAAAFAFDESWLGTPARLDAWVTAPQYTSRPPIILTALPGRPDDARETIDVPVGSVLVVRASGSRLDVNISGGLSEKPVDAVPEGVRERQFVIGGDGTARASGHPVWKFVALPDRPPTIALTKDPERQAHGALLLSYKLEDDYGVTGAEARLEIDAARSAAEGAKSGAANSGGENSGTEKSNTEKSNTENSVAAKTADGAAPARPLYETPSFALVLPHARTRMGVGQTYKDLSEHPFAGAAVNLTLIARDEAGNEGRSQTTKFNLPERAFTQPLARALIEQRRVLALDANRQDLVGVALDALLLAPEIFTPQAGIFLGLRSVRSQLANARDDDGLREVAASLWALAVLIEDGNMSEAEKALRAAQEALRQALERGASDEEIRKLTDQLRAALDNFMRQLAEQLRNNPREIARPLDPNARVIRPDDLRAMLDRMERLSRSGDKDAARQLLEQLQQMLENLQMARPATPGESEMEQALNELGDVIRKQQQLRDRTHKQGQDSRRDRNRGQQKDKNAMSGLGQDQKDLRDRLNKLLEELRKNGLGEMGKKGQQGEGGQVDDLGEAGSAMGEAGEQLGEGDAEGAVDSQGRALEALRRGAQNLARALQQQMGEGQGNMPSNRVGRQQGGGPETDPLGRPLRGRDVDDSSVKVPGEIDVQRARRILEELRRRFADPLRPQIELDYIERLLKD